MAANVAVKAALNNCVAFYLTKHYKKHAILKVNVLCYSLQYKFQHFIFLKLSILMYPAVV
jgi:hypothetical protein